MTTNTITINPNKPSTIDFDVIISGVDSELPIVRFILHDVLEGVDWCIKCSSLDKNKWRVSIPKITDLKLTSCKFSVEVIVDEYYFSPAKGDIQFIDASNVSFKQSSKNKPEVTTSFVVNQDQPSSSIQEAASNVEITGQYAPTNGLLSPEEDPTTKQSHVKTAQAELTDQFIDKARLAGITDEDPIPGEGEQYPQDVLNMDDTESDDNIAFDPKKVAESILQQSFKVVNLNKELDKRGTLFKRDSNGKILVPGLETSKQKQELADRERKIKELLQL